MTILILGATGFIGSAVAKKLIGMGYGVKALARGLNAARIREPRIRWIEGDLRNFTAAAGWDSLLADVTAVVNCAGALQNSGRDDVHAVQEKAMLALYEAARAFPAIRIVQVSAPRNLAASGTGFMKTKLVADNALAVSGIAHVIIRPALVLGRNAHGGSALLRALASFPFATPLVYPDAPVQTVSLEEVVQTVANAAAGTLPDGSDIELAGPATTLAALVAAHRSWLGLPPVPIVSVPRWIANVAAKGADIAGHLGWRSPLRSTAMAIAQGGITAAQTAKDSRVDPLPLDMRDNPAAVQDVWFARLYLLKPLVIVTLAAFWIISGLVPLFDPERAALGFGGALAAVPALALTIATSCADIALGTLVLFHAYARKAMLAMLALSLTYLAGGTLIQPSLWLDPLGPLVKVFPSLILTLAALATLEER